jgi:hypothetical protein
VGGMRWKLGRDKGRPDDKAPAIMDVSFDLVKATGAMPSVLRKQKCSLLSGVKPALARGVRYFESELIGGNDGDAIGDGGAMTLKFFLSRIEKQHLITFWHVGMSIGMAPHGVAWCRME